MNQNIKVNLNKIYSTDEFDYPDEIIEFVKNRFGVEFTNSLEFGINYYHEKDGVEYEATKFKVKWDEITTPVIRDGQIHVDVPITIVESKSSRIQLTAFSVLPEGSNPEGKPQVKTFQDVHALKEWLVKRAENHLGLKPGSISTQLNLSVDDTHIYRALKIADLQRFSDKKFILSERQTDVEENLRELVVDLNNSSLDIGVDSYVFDVRLKDFKYLLDKTEPSYFGRWVDWSSMKTFRSVKPLSELIEKNH